MGFAIERYMGDEVLEAVAAAWSRSPSEAGLSMVEMALAWVLRRDEVASAIVGASRPEQVTPNAAASGIELSAECSRRSTRRSAGVSSPSRGGRLRQEGVKHR